jgi:hypothetical protein
MSTSQKFTRMMLGSHQIWGDAIALLRRLHKHHDLLRKIEAREYEAGAKYVQMCAMAGMEKEVSILLKEQAESAVNASAQKMIDIASRSALVFGHSALDAALADLLRFSAEIDNSVFIKYVREKKRPAKDFLNTDSKTLRESLVGDFLEQLGRESVTRKLDVLFGVCTPEKSCFADEMYPEFTYDKARVERVDRQRHDVVHALSKSPVEIEDILYLDYVSRVSYCIFATHHHVTLDKDAAKDFLRQGV